MTVAQIGSGRASDLTGHVVGSRQGTGTYADRTSEIDVILHPGIQYTCCIQASEGTAFQYQTALGNDV
jgi:hypothetical protein